MEFRVLGPLEVVVGGESVGLGTPRQRTLLGLLLLQAGEVVSGDRLAEDLWDGAPPGTARHTLQAYVHRLRRALGADGWRLQTRPPGYQLKVSAGELDAQRFQDLAEQGRRTLVRGDFRVAADLLERALGLWRGPVLADLSDLAALEPERARLGALHLTTLEDRTEADLALGRHGALVGELQRLVSEHPFQERLRGQLMLALYRSGRQADAVAAFGQARQVLGEELGLDPSPWLSRLHERILIQDPALEAPEPEAFLETTHNLPAPRSNFIGRLRELVELHGLVRTRRLVSVTGPPGSGKTRLAVELAGQLLEDFPHGVFLVSLAELDDPDLVPSAIADVLGLSVGDRSPVEAVVEHFKPRRLLLLLDNCEHVLASAAVVTTLLDAAAGLTVLATSRAPLRLSGEQEYPLAPLPLPPTDEPDADPAEYDAPALFADRAATVDPRFVLGGDNAPVVAQVVARLDGLPLAIELAAARLRLFPLDELHRRLDFALPLLTRGPVDAAARQRTMRDAVAWSDHLLAPADQALLRRLAVFRGGFTLDAAQAVASGPPVEDFVAGISTLLEASLLQRPAEADQTRLAMLETVREYAVEQLRAAGEEEKIGERHARCYAALVDQAEPELTGAGQAAWLKRLDAEHANLRSALSWAERAGDTDLALLMAGRLWRFWQLRGHFAEGRRWLEDLLAAHGPVNVPRAKAVLGLAGICYWQFDLDPAEDGYRQARELARQLDDWWLELEALIGQVAVVACHRGDQEAAARLEGEFQALIAGHPEPLAIGFGMATSQMIRLFAGDLEGSRSYGEPLLAACREFGYPWYESQTLRTLALTSLLLRRYEQAEEELRECLRIAWELGDLAGAAMDFDRLGQAAVARERPERAVILSAAAARLRESVGGGLTVEAFRWETEPARDAARRFLTDAEIDTAWARGRTMSLQDAVAYARTA